jgi:hypothetical protein
MDEVSEFFMHATLIGVGATAVMDVWGYLRKRLFSIPAMNYGLVGRWIGHLARGRFRHDAIAASSPVRYEPLIGWTVHYFIGIAFAAMLLAIVGLEWAERPVLLPALLFGIGTVAAPFLLMQPGMGLGVAASRTPRPAAARVQSLITHGMFGLGLYATACIVNLLARL